MLRDTGEAGGGSAPGHSAADADGGAARRVLVVSAAMGGGHLEVSRELTRRLTERGHPVEIVDLTELMPGPTGRWLRATYPWLVNRAPWLYDLVYRRFLAPRRGPRDRASHGRVALPVRLALPGLRREIARFRPDVVVSTYHLAALAVARLRADGRLPCPAVTFITTFSVHRSWLHPATDAYLCISHDAAREVRRRGGGPTRVCGPVVRDGFAGSPADGRERERVRRDLGAADGDRIALIVTGSLGLGSVQRAVAAFAGRPGWVPVVVCGRNENLRRELSEMDGCRALGWVADMPAAMAAADVLIENAGGLCSKEALRAGLPIVTFRPISGHGRDDSAALARLALTDLVDDESALLTAVDRLTTDTGRRTDRIGRGQALFDGDAADHVASLARDGLAGRRSAPSA